MRLKLPSVTLLSLDTTPNVMRSISALVRSTRLVEFGAVKLVTDLEKNVVAEICVRNGIEPIHHAHVNNRLQYEIDQLTQIHHWVDTSHVLFQEWDSAVVNPANWNPVWMVYDYIGAPWPEQHDFVGNGGFSIRSRHWCEALAGMVNIRDNALERSDNYACITLGPRMIKNGFVIAPYHVAAEFSCENRIYSGEFGFHGKDTMKINGWNLDQMGWLLK